MELAQARVQNFRSIIDTGWVDIHEDITTLLGPNESGKTSFLQAINQFGEGVEYNENEINRPEGVSDHFLLPIVSLKFDLDKNDQDIIKSIANKQPDELYLQSYSDGSIKFIKNKESRSPPKGIVNKSYLRNLVESLQNYVLTEVRTKDENYISDKGDELNPTLETGLNQGLDPENLEKMTELLRPLISVLKSEGDKEKLTEIKREIESEQKRFAENGTETSKILELIPTSIYHSSANLLSDTAHINNIQSDDHRPFRNLLDICGIDYDNFESKSAQEQVRATDRAEATIEGKVNELWEQKSVDVSLNYNSGKFIVHIQDKKVNGSDVLNRDFVAPSQRSRGFQWFFSFYINLRARANEKAKNTIMLLDDPAVFLHPEGKRNWLDAIEEIAEDNQIIYTSHSPFLIRKEYPSRIRVVEDREGKDGENRGTVITDNLIESGETSLEPLREALGIGLGDSLFASKRKILVEGPSDYHILTGVANYFKEYIGKDIINWNEVTILPVGGANKMVQTSKWATSEEFSYVILLDKDQEGKRVADRLQDEASEVSEERVYLLNRDDTDFSIEIEDMFGTEFYIDCVNEVYETELDGFEPIKVTNPEDEEGIKIEDKTYKQQKITTKLNDIFEERGYGELDKGLVSREIEERLNGGDANEEDVQQFYEVMEKLRRAMPGS